MSFDILENSKDKTYKRKYLNFNLNSITGLKSIRIGESFLNEYYTSYKSNTLSQQTKLDLNALTFVYLHQDKIKKVSIDQFNNFQKFDTFFPNFASLKKLKIHDICWGGP